MSGDYRLVYVLGSGRCGSTLLDLIMNGHPEVLALGELSTLVTAARPLEDTDRYSDGSFTAFWNQIRAVYEATTERSWGDLSLQHGRWPDVARWKGPQLDDWLARNKGLLDSAHAVSGCRLIVDASKWPQRFALLRRHPGLELHVIEMVRDGRAVTNSYVERYGDFWGGLRVWMTAAISAAVFRRLTPPDRWLQIRYEDLAGDPEATLRTICHHLGITYLPSMLDYRSQPYFGIGGNPRTRSASGRTISLDERWRHRLSRRRRLAFAVAGGWLNRMRGYGWG